MIRALDSPGSVSAVLKIAPVQRIRQMWEGQTPTKNGSVPRGFYAIERSELVGCGVRLGHQMSAASLQDENARVMPMPDKG